MGDRVLFQCHSKKSGRFGPVVYSHWLGERARLIVGRLTQRMQPRRGDLDYASARLVQECTLAQADADACMGVGVWNADGLLTEKSSHGDAGCVLINVDDFTVDYFGGYLQNLGPAKTAAEQAQDAFYTALAT
jgi:hypothetical protein